MNSSGFAVTDAEFGVLKRHYENFGKSIATWSGQISGEVNDLKSETENLRTNFTKLYGEYNDFGKNMEDWTKKAAEQINDKADKNDVYTKSEASEIFSTKAEVAEVSTIKEKSKTNSARIESLSTEVSDLKKSHRRGMAQMAAMASVDLGKAKAGSVKIGAAVGTHRGESAVAVGVGVSPTDALSFNTKWSTSNDSIKDSTFGLGVSYEFTF